MLRPAVVWLIALGTSLPLAAQPLPPEKQAEMLLGAARQAYNERNYPFAVEKFKEYLQKYAGQPQAPQARWGLAMTYLDMPERKLPEAAEQLQPLAGDRNFSDYPRALYFLGLIKRSQAMAELDQARTKPNEASQRRQNANQRFTEALTHFTAAVAAMKEKIKPDPMATQLTPDEEWLPRAVCEQAEMELRLNKPKEAQTTIAFLVGDGPFTQSRYRSLADYYHGHASFLLGDRASATRSLNQPRVLGDPVFGTHARFLMGRIRQIDGEWTEAAVEFQAVLDQYAKDRTAAQEALKRPDQFKNAPEEKARLEALVRMPPEHVAGATFGAAALHYEAGRFPEALARFTEFVKTHPDSPRVPEAQLHAGFCQVQLKQYPEAIATLTPLPGKQAALADQALLWLGKAQAAHFDPNNPQARTNALNTAIQTLRQAMDRANQLTATDPSARGRRAEIQLELADTHSLNNQHREAAQIYESLLNEKGLPDRAEELTQRLAAALHLAGDFARSDQVCEQFFRSFDKSPLRAAVAFRQAENAYFVALNAIKNPNLPKAERDKVFDEALKRFQAVAEKFPEFERMSLVRYSLALCHIQKGDYEKAQAALESIPPPDRIGELAIVPYQLAGCLIRQAPLTTDDAIAAGRLEEQLQTAATLLDGFISANPQSAETPDALLKLGHCQMRLAQLLAQPPEKQAALQAARKAFDTLMNQHSKDPRVAQAVMERAKVIALAGDRGGAMNELRRFTGAPLQDSPVAAMALLRLATLHREQNQPAEAAKVLDEARRKYEGALTNDKERSAWVALLRYHHGVALLEANKPAEAKPLFDQVVQAPDKTIAAEGALRGGQCRLQEARVKIDLARQKLAMAGMNPGERAAAEKALADAYAGAADAGRYLEAQADTFKQALPTAEPRARMLYDAAWAFRFAAESEITATLNRLATEAQQKLIKELTAKNPASPPAVPLPEIPRASVPLQPSEQKARNAYTQLIAQFAELPLAIESRLELAELHAEREEYQPAVNLLREALDQEPTDELTDRLRLRLGTCLAAMKDPKGAMVQFDLISDPKNPLYAQAAYRAGEALLDLDQPQEAAKRLAIFRDRGEFHNLPGLTDRALLRLGHALAKAEQWEPSRQACELVVARFGNGPWANEARYGCGWARQQMKQFDDAVNWYTQAANASTSELAAKAQLQIGLCRLEQKRYPEAATALLVVPYTYDYPELSAAALCEAARALVEAKQVPLAEKLLQKVLREYESSEWANVAKERLETLKKN